MIHEEIRDKIMLGGRLAFKRLIEKKRLTNGVIAISENGKVVRVNAKDIKLPNE